MNRAEQAMTDAFGSAAMANCRALKPSLDVWSREAHDMLKIAALANFDVKEIMVACFRKAKSGKINVRSVEREMAIQDAKWAKHGREGGIKL